MSTARALYSATSSPAARASSIPIARMSTRARSRYSIAKMPKNMRALSTHSGSPRVQRLRGRL